MRRTDFSDELITAADAFDRLCARIARASDLLCAVALAGTFALALFHAARFALRVLG
jgi:hypothetical protein